MSDDVTAVQIFLRLVADPMVLQRYPAAKAGLESWVARLDAEPNYN